MSDDRTQDMTPQQRRAAEAVRGLPRPTADADFRARLKREFAQGALPGADQPTDEDPAVVVRPAASIWRRVAWAAAAAAAAVALAMFATNPRPGPATLAVAGVGTVTVDGHAVDTDHVGSLNALLHAGARVAVSDGVTLDLRYPGTMAWRLEPGTTAVLPAAPGRWWGRSIRCEVEVGETGLRTGPDFPGAHLAIATGEGAAIVTGTLVSVYRDAEVTCVCVQEGEVRMEDADGDPLGAVPAGKRTVLFRDGRPPLIDDAIAPPHQKHLLEFDSACANAFPPAD